MHVVHHPHLPRLVSVTILAAILSIMIALALATRLSDSSQPVLTTGGPAHHTALALTSAPHTAAPQWVKSPFTSLLSRPLPPLWPAARP